MTEGSEFRGIQSGEIKGRSIIAQVVSRWRHMLSNKKRLLLLAVLFVTVVLKNPVPSYSQDIEHPLKGQKVEMSFLGIEGWLSSRLGVYTSSDFVAYAKKNYGYDVNFTFTDSPFSEWYQKAATSFEKGSQKYNILICDSQWLQAFAEKGWIVNINDIIDIHPELNIEWWDPIVKETYMDPLSSGQLWGMPQEADVISLFVRKDLFEDKKERQAFLKKYGRDLPQTFEDFEKLSMQEFEKIAEFFTRPEEGLYGTVMAYSPEYDFLSMYLNVFMFSMGGEIWDEEDKRIYGILNSEINKNALKRYKKLLKYQNPNVVNYGVIETIEAFSEGKVATAFQWAAVGIAMISPESKDKVMVVPPPGFKQRNGSLKRLYPIGGQPWIINAFNDELHMRVAIDFLKWWYLPEVQLRFAEKGGNPAMKSILENPGFDEIQPWFRALKYMLKKKYSRDLWHTSQYGKLLEIQQEAFRAYIIGQIDDPSLVLEYIACQQQKVLFDSGESDIPSPKKCATVTLR
jgi:multiple sugar transport system substrate-binding protein